MAQKQDDISTKESSAQDSERGRALPAALAQIERQFGKGSLMRLGDKEQIQIPSISSGSISANLVAVLLFT